MKNSVIKPRRCKLKECQVSFTPNNSKGAYCCAEHRLIDNAKRRSERDAAINSWLKGFKKNYQILLLHTSGTTVSRSDLISIGFSFACLPNLDDSLIHWFGNLGLLNNFDEQLTYQIIKK